MSKEGTNPAEGDAYVFGNFKLVPKARALYESDRIVKIGGRAFDVLVALVESAGSVVTPHELIARVWQDVVVDEAHLRVHIASLRKALRDGREGRRLIATSIGSGYTFTERVTRVQAASAAQSPPPPERRDPGLPRSSPMIGREGLEASIVDAVSRRRLVTLVGPGGIGKTSLAIAAADAAERPVLFDALAGLIEKSLLVTHPRGEDVRFRLLELTRAYGLEQLRASGELALALRRHATYYLTVCEDAERQLPTRPASAWIAAYRWRMDDVRAALSWSFGPSGDAAMGAALTVASITLWLEVSAMDEFRQHVERALAYLHDHPSTRAAEGEVRLKLALGVMIMHTAGPIPAMTQAIGEGLAVAEKLSPALHMEALGAMWIDGHARADYHTMLEMAERFAPYADATSDQAPRLIAARMMAWARHTHARYDEGLRLAERVLAVPPPPRVTYGTQRADGRVMMHTLIARTLWLTGRPESALREVRQGVDVALELRHAGTLCYALSLGACPVALWSGETVEASGYITQLIETASRTSLGFWLIWGRAFERVLRLSAGHGLRAGELGTGASLCDHLVTIRADLLDQPTEARIESGELGWAAPEVQRAKAARVISSGDIDGAERLLLEALAASERQGALSWELRIATTLAQLRRDRGDVREARDLLVETMSRFVEGATTTDHRNAAAVLASLPR